jgi:phosphate transport system permease protein
MLDTVTSVGQAQTAERAAARRSYRNWRLWQDTMAGRTMAVLTIVVAGFIVLIGGLLLFHAWPILSHYSPFTLLFSSEWNPDNGQFGFWPFIVGSAAVTLIAMILAVPTALLSAIYLSEYTSARSVIKPIVDLLASIPSVIYGLWGVLFVVPLVRDVIAPVSSQTVGKVIPFFQGNYPTGYSLLAAGVVLAVMVFPFIVSVSEEVLRSVPDGLREASLAMGATQWETTKYVVLRKALPGVVAAVVLGFSRAFGETLAVVMVVGNVVQIPHSLFDGVYPIPALIANNYGEMMSIPLYESALMTAALILLAVVLLFNLGARFFLRRVRSQKNDAQTKT